MSNDVFAEVADLLFGAGASELVAKANPDSADLGTVATHKDRKKRKITAGLNAVGATAGVAGLGYAGYKTGGEYRRAPKNLNTARRAARAIKGEKFGAALIPLEVAGLGGELMATKILHNDAKKKPVVKTFTNTPKGKLVKYTGNKVEAKAKVVIPATAEKTKSQLKGSLKKLKTQVAKSETIEVAKMDEDKRQIFGWASVVEKDGQAVVDLQGDFIPVEEMEKAAYDYVRKSRQAGDMHRRVGNSPFVVGEMIESFALTPEKKAAMGLPASMPSAWWVGYQIEDPQVWADIKSGKRKGFSVHGTGQRSPA